MYISWFLLERFLKKNWSSYFVYSINKVYRNKKGRCFDFQHILNNNESVFVIAGHQVLIHYLKVS